MAIETMKQLMLEELREIYSAERLALRAYPGMRKAIQTQSLREAIERHVEETREQVERLGQLFEMMDARTRGKTCNAIQGLIEEAQEHLDADLSPALLEVMLVADLQKIEHFEIAAYGSARAHAEALGLTEAVALLEETLNEEKQADTLLNQIAVEEVNPNAVGAPQEDEAVVAVEAEKPPRKSAARKSAGASSKSKESEPAQASQANGTPKSRTPRGAKGAARPQTRAGGGARAGRSG
jgi:ferritin-like metal-binding protein YciE